MIRTGFFRPSPLSCTHFHGSRLASRQLSARSRIVFSDFAIPKRSYRISIKPRRFSTYTGGQSHFSGTTAKVSSFAGASIAFALLFSAAGLWFVDEAYAEAAGRTSPLKGDYLEGLPDKNGNRAAAEKRLGVLDVSGMTQQELSATLGWLNTRYHGFMYLIGEVEDLSASAATLQKISKILQDKAKAFQDRASHYECAQFAVLCYGSADEIRRSLKGAGLSDWDLVPTSMAKDCVYIDKPSGYGGVAFVNHEQGQVIVAHRGTEPPRLGKSDPSDGWWSWMRGGVSRAEQSMSSVVEFVKDLNIDRVEVAAHKVGKQQEKAVAFSESVLKEFEGTGYRVGNAGHSLGGWLAQITTADAAREKGHEETYAVCLDSPGTKEMLDGIYRAKYGTNPDREIDVTNFVLLPNMVNTSGTHAGTVYQIFSPGLDQSSYRNTASYLLKTHSSENILAGFQGGRTEQMKVHLVEEWPSIDWKNAVGWNATSVGLDTLGRWFSWSPLRGLLSFLGNSASERTRSYREFFDNVPEWEDTAKGEELSRSSFGKRYHARYKVRPFDPKEIRKVHASPAARQVLSHITGLFQVANTGTVAEFLKRQVFADIAHSSLPLLQKVRSTEKMFSLSEGSALELVREAERLVRCMLVGKRFSLERFLQFSHFVAPYLSMSESIEVQGYPLFDPRSVARTGVVEAIERELKGAQVVRVVGPAGSGKTEVAKQVCAAAKGKLIRFFDASDPEIFRRQWLEFAFFDLGIQHPLERLSDIQEITEKVYAQLRDTDGSLLVFNKVEGDETIGEYLPDGGLSKKIQVLVTTAASSEEQENWPTVRLTDHPLDPEALTMLAGVPTDTFQWPECIDLLKQSPSLAEILPRFFKSTGTLDRMKRECASLKGERLAEAIAERVVHHYIPTSQLGSDACSPEMLLVFTLSLLDQEEVATEFVENWLLSGQARTLLTDDLGRDEVRGCLEKLEREGVLRKTGENSLAVNSKVFESLRTHSKSLLSEDLSQELEKRYGRFLLEQTTMRNMQRRDYKGNEQARPQVEHFFSAQFFSSAGKEKESAAAAVEVLTVFQRTANNYLQSQSFIHALSLFSKVEDNCVRLAGLASGDSIGDVVAKMRTQDKRLPLLYARSLHYKGKILFQSGRLEEAQKCFTRAVEIRKTELGPKRSKQPDMDLVIFQRQGPGWAFLESEDPSDWVRATKLYSQLYQDEPHPFNHYYCNLQLGRAYYKRAKENLDPIKKRHYYRRAIDRLTRGGEKWSVPFEGALVVGKRHGYMDAEPAVSLQMGTILGDPDNPFCDFQQAERYLLHVLEMGKPGSGEKPVNSSTIFLTYCALAELYQRQIVEHPHTENLRFVSNRAFSAKAKGAVQKAFDWFAAMPKKGFILGRRKAEIERLQALLDD